MHYPTYFYNYLLYVLFCVLLCPVYLMAATTPEATVQEAVNALKTKKTLVSVFDFVHWDAAYKEQKDKGLLPKVLKSPAEYREFLSVVMTDPKAAYLTHREAIRETLPTNLQDGYDQYASQVMEVLRQRIVSANQVLEKVSYQVGKAEINGDTAIVGIQVSLDGKITIRNIKLIKIGQGWFLSTVNVFSQ